MARRVSRRTIPRQSTTPTRSSRRAARSSACIWRNPHVRFQVSTKSFDGNDQLWEIESADLTRLDRAGLPRDLLEVGDVVTFAGNPSTRRERRMYVTNLLVADGREILLAATSRRAGRPIAS